MKNLKFIGLLAAAAVLGQLALNMPIWSLLLGRPRTMEAIISLAAVALAVGYFCQKLEPKATNRVPGPKGAPGSPVKSVGLMTNVSRPFWAGAGTMAGYPVQALVDVLRDPTSHNLIPFEVVGWSIVGFPAGVVAVMGFILARLVDRAIRGSRQDP